MALIERVDDRIGKAMGLNEENEPSLTERRRAAYERAVDRYRARGTPIDRDPVFVALISQWIEGSIEMSDVAARSSPSGRNVVLKSEISATGKTNEIPMSNDQLLSELNRMIGLHDTSMSQP